MEVASGAPLASAAGTREAAHDWACPCAAAVLRHGSRTCDSGIACWEADAIGTVSEGSQSARVHRGVVGSKQASPIWLGPSATTYPSCARVHWASSEVRSVTARRRVDRPPSWVRQAHLACRATHYPALNVWECPQRRASGARATGTHCAHSAPAGGVEARGAATEDGALRRDARDISLVHRAIRPSACCGDPLVHSAVCPRACCDIASQHGALRSRGACCN